MTNVNRHISEFLNYYYNFGEPPEYAVLLKGAWGSGKSWFIQKTLKEYKASGGNYLYVSLYGVSSFGEVEDSFFQQLHPILSSKGMSLASRVLKGVVKASIQIDIDGDGKSDGSVSSQIPNINIPDYLNNTENHVLVFDDLERCSMNVIDVLGYINNFVERQGYKVVLVFNEEEIKNDERYKKTYPRIKEKLIGKTFEIKPDLEEAFYHFVECTNSQEVKEVLLTNKSLITELYLCSGYDNLRHLKQSLWDFERLYLELPDSACEKLDLINSLLSIYMVYSFEIRSGSISTQDIKDSKNNYWVDFFSKDDGNKSIYSKALSKYHWVNFGDVIFDESLWFDILDKGELNKQKIKKSIEKSTFYGEENTENWVKLWHYEKLSDERFDNLVATVLGEIDDKKFDDVNELKHVAGIFFKFSDIGLIQYGKEELLERFCAYADHLKNTGKIRPDPRKDMNLLECDSWDGLGFAGMDVNEFSEFNRYLEDTIEQSRIDNYPYVAKDLLDLMVNDSSMFMFKLILSEGEHNYLYETPILQYIDEHEFVNGMISLSPSDMHNVGYMFKKRYGDKEFNKVLRYELSWIKDVKKLLLDEKKKHHGKLSGFRLSEFINNYVNIAIENLTRSLG